MRSHRTAVVVGSGPNGLAGAIELARAGLRVVVHEASDRAGGGMRTEELTLPGFRHDVCSAIHPLARVSPAFRGLGVDWIHSPLPFAHTPGRSGFAGCCAHSGLPVWRPASVGVGAVLFALARTTGWPFPRGGAQTLADALAARLRGLGGEIRTSSPVDAIPDADVVLCDTRPDFVGRSIRYGPGAFKVDWALERPIPWRDGRLALAATVHIAGPPFVILAQPSLWDDTRAPAGRHTAWAYCHVPNGSSIDMTAAIEAQLERFAPGFGERVLARSVLGPRELEAHDGNLVGGDVNGGAMTVGRVLAGHRTRLRGVYLCSASTAPGGGVHGLCGLLAARKALRDLRMQ